MPDKMPMEQLSFARKVSLRFAMLMQASWGKIIPAMIVFCLIGLPGNGFAPGFAQIRGAQGNDDFFSSDGWEELPAQKIRSEDSGLEDSGLEDSGLENSGVNLPAQEKNAPANPASIARSQNIPGLSLSPPPAATKQQARKSKPLSQDFLRIIQKRIDDVKQTGGKKQAIRSGAPEKTITPVVANFVTIRPPKKPLSGKIFFIAGKQAGAQKQQTSKALISTSPPYFVKPRSKPALFSFSRQLPPSRAIAASGALRRLAKTQIPPPIALQGLNQAEIFLPAPRKPVFISGWQHPPRAKAKPLIFIWPAEGEIVAPADGKGENRRGNGIVLSLTPGSEIYAAERGVVQYSSQLGAIIIIDHGQNWRSVYTRLGKILVKKGDKITKGQKIAIFVPQESKISTRRTQTGRKTNKENFYFDLYHKRNKINPLDLLDL